MRRGLGQVVERSGQLRSLTSVFPLFYWENQLVLERIFEYNGSMELGDPTATTRDQRSRLPMTPSTTFNNSLTDLIDYPRHRRT